MSIEGLSLNLATVRAQWDLRKSVEACARFGIAGVAPWRDQIVAVGPEEAARIFNANGLRVTGYCRGGLFTAADAYMREYRIVVPRNCVGAKSGEGVRRALTSMRSVLDARTPPARALRLSKTHL